MKTEGNMITDWLDQNGNPEIDRFIEKNLAITEKIRLALAEKEWNWYGNEVRELEDIKRINKEVMGKMTFTNQFFKNILNTPT
jgi:spore cortex formation protein SpoVR/YcgB (stage V sporulation)